MKFYIVLTWMLWCASCYGLPMEDTVVSVYTTKATTSGTNNSLDVYHQIANNIAERITSPIFRFLGINSTMSTIDNSSTRPWNIIELFDDQDLSLKPDVKPVDNDIAKERDVEELSVDALTKPDKKPEKFTLYSSLYRSYLPTKLEAEVTTTKEVDVDLDSFEFSDEEPVKAREGPLIFVMEFLGSIIQLVWGGLMSLFKSPGS